MTTQTQVRSTEEALSIEDTSARSALKLALEALEDYVEEYGPHEKDSGAAYVITAIKEALEQPASYKQEPVGFAVMQKPWVGLTDEEIDKYFNEQWCGYSGYHDCFKEVMCWQEAKLKEKNFS